MKRFLPLAAVLSVGLLLPQSAQAWTSQVCAGPTLVPCVDFELTHQGGSTYHFSVYYFGGFDPGYQYSGVITAIGLYGLSGSSYSFSDLAIVPGSDGNWDIAANEHCHLTGAGVGAPLFEACADATPPPVDNGLFWGQTVTFSFTSNVALSETNFGSTGDLGARVHIQALTETECSIKLDSRIPGQFSGEGCGPVTVPEPTSLLLLGSGLLGLGVAVRRRRNGIELE